MRFSVRPELYCDECRLLTLQAITGLRDYLAATIAPEERDADRLAAIDA